MYIVIYRYWHLNQYDCQHNSCEISNLRCQTIRQFSTFLTIVLTEEPQFFIKLIKLIPKLKFPCIDKHCTVV